MLIKKNNLLNIYFAIVVIFSSWIIFYTIPRGLQYIAFFIPSILIIFNKYLTLNNDRLLRFILFAIILFRYSIPPEFSFTDISLYANLSRSILMASIFLISDFRLKLIYQYFKKIIIIILVLSLFFYILYILGIYPFSSIGRYTPGEGLGRTWNIYMFFSLQVHPNYGESLRFASIFDEPGYLGTILAFILVIEKLNLKERGNQIILLAGLLTFSLAFYMLIGIYFLFSLNIKIKQKVRLVILFVVALLLVKFILPDVFQTKIVDRIFIEDSISLAEDNRVGFEKQSAIFYELSKLDFNNLLFGLGYRGHEYFGSSTSVNWSWIVFQIGIIFTLFFLFLIFYYARNSYQNTIFAILFVVSIIQRPAIFDIIWFFLLVYGITINNININCKYNPSLETNKLKDYI